MFELFFHSLPSKSSAFTMNDLVPMFITWLILIPLVLWLTRLIYKSIRKPIITYNKTRVILRRDLFLDLGGFEYLIIIVALTAIYLGFWAYYVSPFAADWFDWRTYVVLLPQVCLILTIIVLFVIRYVKFRKPFIK
jgi:hypothetical protein